MVGQRPRFNTCNVLNTLLNIEYNDCSRLSGVQTAVQIGTCVEGV